MPVAATHAPSDEAVASLVISHAPLYHSTASRLTSLDDMPVPDASLSADLLSLLPRMKRIDDVQSKQECQVAELADRSAELLERWYNIGIVSMGECWSEWEARIVGSERALRQEQARRRRED